MPGHAWATSGRVSRRDGVELAPKVTCMRNKGDEGDSKWKRVVRNCNHQGKGSILHISQGKRQVWSPSGMFS